MRSPRRSTTWLVNIRPALLSNKRPARTATTRGAGAHLTTPPSTPKHGCGPAPRQGAPGPPTGCAQSMGARIRTPHIPSAAVFNADSHRLASPPGIFRSLRRHRRHSLEREFLGSAVPDVIDFSEIDKRHRVYADLPPLSL